jgi:hypothetical protein
LGLRQAAALSPQQVQTALRFSDMRRVMTFARPFVLSLFVLGAAGVIGAWTPAPARSAGVPSGPVPSLPTAAPSPQPTASATLPPGATLHVPMIRLAHLYISEGSYLVDKSYIGGPIDCGTAPARWGSSAKSNLRAGFTGEKAYFQEKDAFGPPTLIGFFPETNERACINFVVNVGHYTGDKLASAFFITARHNVGGSMYCIASIGGTLPSGEVGVSLGGGPILNPDQCAALPVFTPVTFFSPGTAVRPALPGVTTPNNAASSAVAPALSKAATPYNLNLTNDLMTCAQHTGDQNACEFDILNNRAIMIWVAGTSCGTWPSCTTHIAGFRIYNVPPGQSKTSVPVSNATLSQSAVSSVASTVHATPTPNPALMPANPFPKRVLVQTMAASDHKGGIATAAGVYASYVKPGQCFVVVAYLGNGDESDDSPQYCVAGPVKVGPLNLDLTPAVLVTAYGHKNSCTDVPPFARPSGSVLVGYTVTQGTNDYPPGYRCTQYQGLMKFDLSGISPPLVYKATLTYSNIQNYKANGSIDSSPGECPPVFDNTSDNWSGSATDPRAGLVTLGSEITSGYHSVDVTAAVNAMLQSGINNGFVMHTTDWNGPGSSCFTAFGDFHLNIVAFGH